MTEFNTAIEARAASRILHLRMRSLPYNQGLRKLHENIEIMISELSMLEVKARQQHSQRLTQDKCNEIKEAMDRFEKLLLVLQLLQ